MDFFLNNDDSYSIQIKEIFNILKEDGFKWDRENDFISNKTFTSFKVRWSKSEASLKLDFVNDVSAHFGGFIQTQFYPRIDSIRNMLSNKLTALFRFNPKDVADIREISLRELIDWSQAIKDAREKEAGIEIPVVCDILQGMPQSEFETIAWTKKPKWEQFRSDIEKIVYNMMNG